jgi:hypothetical protein
MQNGAPIYLLDGDALRIGDTHLVVRFNPIEPAGPDTPAATPAPQSAADVTMIRSRLAVTAIARSSAPIPDELTARLATAAGLFGGIADSVPEVGLMIRWPVTDPPDEADHQCEHFREFAKMLADKAGVPIDWMLTHT